MSDLPEIELNTPPSDDFGVAVRRGTQDILKILNSLPAGAMLPTVCSVVASMCAAQRDPDDCLTTISLTAARALDKIEAMPVAGNA